MSLRTLASSALILLLVISGTALAGNPDTFTEWARANGSQQAATAGVMVFGDVVDSFPSNNQSPIGLAYDATENGLWLANESGGELLLIDAAAPHAVIRAINIQGYNLTTDGNHDGVAVIGDYLYVTDFDGDQYMTDDLIYRIDRVTGDLLAWWFVDGFLNPNPDAHINMIMGISDDGAGNFWITDNEGNLHNVSLLANGEWVQNSVQAVPGGGSWAGIDYDTCLEEFFTANFGTGVFNYHTAMPASPDMSAPAAGPNVTGITSNNDGVIWTVGFGDGIIYRHEGISCAVAVEPATWGSIKGIYRDATR